ncbi:nuclear transport factor 2 family protein [Microbacterium neimengense]
MSIRRRPAPLLIGSIALLTAGIALTGCAAMPASAGDASTAATTTGDAGSTMSPAEQANQTLVTQLITEAFPNPDSPDADAAAQAAMAPDAVAHGAGLTAGPDGLLAQFRADHARVPGAQAVIKHQGADGDLVAVHWQIAEDPDDERTGEAAVDLFRVTDGKITERWSFAQPIPQGTPASGNTNTMFSDLYEPGDQESTPTPELDEANKKLVVDAYNTLFRDHDVSVLDRAFDPNYLQHNSVAPNGTAALKTFFAGTTFPPQQAVLSVSDGGLVWIFSQPVGAGANDAFPAADIFRVDDGLIREHWDVVPPTAG